MNGRANPNASRHSTRQRRRRRKIFSNRLRRVTPGGVGIRNISELKTVFSREVRRMRWDTTGKATARAPAKKSGARKLILQHAAYNPNWAQSFLLDPPV